MRLVFIPLLMLYEGLVYKRIYFPEQYNENLTECKGKNKFLTYSNKHFARKLLNKSF
jgi:hypothetical protein